jgi:hypothetical protein
MNWFDEVLKELHLLIHNKDFGFMPSCPTYNSIANKSLLNTRIRLIKETL